MREILFKAKRIDNGEWVEGSLFCENSRYEIARGSCNGIGIESVEVYEKSICQYTGLVDKHGNKIWENDIVGLYSEYHQEYYCGQVEYGAFNCSCCNGVYGWHFNEEDIREHSCYEVLGNIFDNPELLDR